MTLPRDSHQNKPAKPDLANAHNQNESNVTPPWVVGDDGLDWLRTRGVNDNTIAAFGIVASGDGCKFPSSFDDEFRIWKASDSNRVPKYTLPGAIPDHAVLYHAPNMAAATLYLRSGAAGLSALRLTVPQERRQFPH